MTTQSATIDAAPTTASDPTPPPSRRTRTKIVAVVLAAGIVLGAGGIVASQKQHAAAELAAATVALSTATEERGPLAARATTAIAAAEAVLAQSQDAVADNAVRATLQEAVSTLQTAAPASEGAASEDQSLAGVRAQTAAALAANASYAALVDAVDDAAAAVSAAHVEWELAQAVAGYDQAGTDLQGALDAANAIQTGSEGKVADNMVREGLSVALTTAGAALAPADTPDLTTVTAATTVRTDARAGLEAAGAAVTAAQTEWEAARQAERDAEAARVAAATRSAKATTATPAAPKTSAKASGPAPAATQTIASVANAEAARFGVTVSWVVTTAGGDTGSLTSSYLVLRGSVTDGESQTIELSIGTADPNQPGSSKVYASIRGIVRHEAAHIAASRTCGTVIPPIVGDRVENVTDAYAVLFHGGSNMHYGYNDNDAAIATAIHEGRCS